MDFGLGLDCDNTHQRTSSTQSSETVVSHVVAGGDVHTGQAGTVSSQGVTRVVCQPGAGAEIQSLNVGTVPRKDQESMVSHSLSYFNYFLT